MFKEGPVKIKKNVLEKHVEAAVCRHAKSKGFEAEKFTSPNKRSVPDRLITGPGRKIFYIEFKAPGKLPTANQLRDHAKRRANGFEVYVVDDIDQGKAIIDRWCDA